MYNNIVVKYKLYKVNVYLIEKFFIKKRKHLSGIPGYNRDPELHTVYRPIANANLTHI